MANIQVCENAAYQAELGLLDSLQSSFLAGYMAAYCPLWEALGMNSPRIPAFVEQYEAVTSPGSPTT